MKCFPVSFDAQPGEALDRLVHQRGCRKRCGAARALAARLAAPWHRRLGSAVASARIRPACDRRLEAVSLLLAERQATSRHPFPGRFAA